MLERIETLPVYLNRDKIKFSEYAAQKRLWVCGTSLVPIGNGLVKAAIENENEIDCKIILPDVSDADAASYKQLLEYDQKGDLGIGQIQTAQTIYTKLQHFGSEHIRLYKGILYQNITLIDDTMFISFYDASGIGDKLITINCTGASGQFKKKIETLFTDMWDSVINTDQGDAK
jgi:hypothetical protein